MREKMLLIKVLTTPLCWLQNYEYSRELDIEINRLLDSGETFKDITGYEATLGDLRLWVENHPYASFTIMRARPSRATILRAMDKLVVDMMEQNEKENRRSSSR